MSSQQQKTALIFGATGAVGKQLLKDLLQNSQYTKIVSLGRRNVELEDTIPQEKLVQKKIDFENLEASRNDFKDVSDVYCCFGTTRADAGGAEQFKKIDQTYVLNSAKLIVEENKKDAQLAPVHFLYCSTANANKNSYFLYPKSKGETEHGLAEAGFEKVSIFRPGLLDLVEERPRPRFGEKLFSTIFLPVDKFFGLGGSVSVVTVGKAMHKAAENYSTIKPTEKKTSQIGSLVSIFSNKDIENIGNPNN